ncbi:TIGR03016 family PEP-CTERM system-associated outer membrane protein [Paraglaciecola sp. 25GB23A]|uniref:TIGR03016 family PEP-CTERM system-associated outer membrane protein n=1 Tax=Paraglaciecola sp. 25GB23A TaxID=3156068 RepID=UPI0032AF1F09
MSLADSYFKLIPRAIIATTLLVPHTLIAGELTFNKALNTKGIVYETKRDNEENQEGYALTVNPSLVSIFQSKGGYGDFTINHTKVEQGGYDEAYDRSYTDYNLNSTATLIENMLRLSVNASQGYRAGSQLDGFVTDRLLSANELSKTKKHTGLLNFTTPNPSFVGVNWQALYSKTSADNSINDGSALSSDNKGLTLSLYNGRNLQRISFNFGAQYNDTTRRNNQNFESQIINGNIRFGLFEDLSFVLLGSDSAYNISSENASANRRNIDTTSYGAGLRWSPSNARYIELSYNKLEQDLQETKYLGLSSSWAFTERTRLGLEYGKRFYGDAYSANLSYNLKSFRSSMSYSEDVTSYSRLSFSEVSLGLFVCPVGSIEFFECFQPNDLSYVLEPGEEFRSYNDITSDITDEVILNKVGQIALGYDKKKLKLSLNYRYANTEYLESQRLQKNKTLSVNASYQLAKSTTLSLTTNLSKRNRDSENAIGNEDTLTITLGLNRNVSKRTSISSSFRYLDRDSDSSERNITDNRLTVGLNYTF